MKARNGRPWRLPRLKDRLSWWEARGRRMKRDTRGGGDIWDHAGPICIGKNHRQAPRAATQRPVVTPQPLLLRPAKHSTDCPAQRPAARPSWAIMRGKPRKGLGYSGSPSDWESL